MRDARYAMRDTRFYVFFIRHTQSLASKNRLLVVVEPSVKITDIFQRPLDNEFVLSYVHKLLFNTLNLACPSIVCVPTAKSPLVASSMMPLESQR